MQLRDKLNEQGTDCSEFEILIPELKLFQEKWLKNSESQKTENKVYFKISQDRKCFVTFSILAESISYLRVLFKCFFATKRRITPADIRRMT